MRLCLFCSFVFLWVENEESFQRSLGKTSPGPNYEPNDAQVVKKYPEWKFGSNARNTLETKGKYEYYLRSPQEDEVKPREFQWESLVFLGGSSNQTKPTWSEGKKSETWELDSKIDSPLLQKPTKELLGRNTTQQRDQKSQMTRHFHSE